MTHWKSWNHRSIRPEVFWKKGVFKNFAKFTGKHLCQSLFFPVNFAKFLRTPIFTEHLSWLLLKSENKSHSYKPTVKVTLTALTFMTTITFYLSSGYIAIYNIYLYFRYVCNNIHLIMNAIIIFYVKLFACFSEKRFHRKY